MHITVSLDQVLFKIWDSTAGQLKHFCRPKPHIEELKKARERLKAKAADIDSSICLAELEGCIQSNEIAQWKRETKELEDKADETEQDFERRRCPGGWSWNCFSVNRRVAKRIEEIDKLMTRSDATPVVIKPPPSAVVQIPISNSMLGMEAYMREILGYIDGPDASGIIGVYGKGGVGKTTLLNKINNHKAVARFDLVIWAVASRECKMERLQMMIAKRLKLRLEEDDTEEDRAAKLFNFLKNKECLLLLDDLWEPLDLAKLGMPHAPSEQAEGKRKVVVFTTRNEQVCGSMTAGKKMEIKCLEKEQAWKLFQMNVGEDAIGSDPGINQIAHLISQECGGLPLALITVGKAMSTKKSWEAWNDALRLMKHSQMPKVTGMMKPDPMFSAFKLSYDNLEDDDMRGRLLSCTLWPEDNSIDKDKLIECWIGLGLIDDEGAIHKAYNRGHSHIETLKAVCMLEPGDDKETKVKMHDVIRDMALWTASDCGKKKFKWVVRAGVVASQMIEEEGWHETERVSLMYNNIASLPNQLSTCSKLSVLMLQYNEELKEIHGTLIQAMCSLTYLDLEKTGITEIPKEIGMLSELRHLNLSNTQIKELPAELGCLVKLNYLLLRNMYIFIIVTRGAISNLASLRFLDLRGSYSFGWLYELEGIKGCQKCYIGINIFMSESFQRLCSLPHVLIWRLSVMHCFDSDNLNQLLDDIVNNHKTRQSLEHLTIEEVNIEELLISKGNKEAGGLECLKYLHLNTLAKLEEITWKGILPQIVFPNLRELIISYCKRLRNVNWVLQLPSLSVLKIEYCDAMEELISDKGSTYPSHFSLRRMMLRKVLKLTRISWRSLSLPNLEEIEVLCCPLLKKLSFDNVNRLQVIQCEQNWWDKLEWEDESIKMSLSPLVRFGKDLLPLVAIEQIRTSHSTVGIEECMRMILSYIDSGNAAPVIGVHGMGGVGKTTLLRKIYNHINVDNFDRVIWAVASRECKIERLQQDIADWFNFLLQEDNTKRDRASLLFDLLENKDCLLLLDDLWAPLDLMMLGMARGTPEARKQKRKVVVFTTRNKQVCSDMNASTWIEIKCLEQEQGWELFRMNAGEDAIRSDPRIDHIAHLIAQECAGLPLTLITVGKAMSTKKPWEAWNDVLTMMKKEVDPMFSAFKLSYDSLEDDHMRDRLLSCALWPEYLSIDKDKLIVCWMGLGLIDEEDAIYKAYERGYSHIETLKAACLLEPDNDKERKVKMHDMIRDMALLMNSSYKMKKFKWIVRGGLLESEVLEEEIWHEAERVSLMNNHIASLPNQLSTCSKLSVLMLQKNNKLKEICGTLIQAMRALTYLDLEDTCIIEVPKEIGLLSQLRHLNLSCTPIRELPAELGCLVNLNNLFLREMKGLEIVAKGAISSLSSLKFLDLRGSYHVDWLDELESLKGCQKCSIGINIGTAAALQRLCSLPHVLIWRLNVDRSSESANPYQFLNDIMKSHNTRQNIEQLIIVGKEMNELLIIEGNEEADGLECLKNLYLFDLTKLEEITWKGVLPQRVFPNLHKLSIFMCTKLRTINWLLELPSLSNLEIFCCYAMEELISDEGNSSSSSIGLKKMKLFGMDELKRISWRPLNFPYLEEIEIKDCPLLAKLPFDNVNKLQVIRCKKTWWDNLKWEDESIKHALSPLRRRIRAKTKATNVD